MKKTVTTLVVLALFVAFGNSSYVDNLFVRSGTADSLISVSVQLVFTNYTDANFIPAMTLSVSQGTNAFELLQQASVGSPCYRFQFLTYSFGHYITAICCLEQDQSTHFSWFVYKNGVISQVGVDEIIPENGDIITFKYQR